MTGGVVTDPIDISKYKCVPLDLLRNVSGDDKVQFTVNPRNTSLKDFKESSDETRTAAGPLAGDDTFSADTIENIIIGFCVGFAVLFGIIALFYFGLNLTTYGTGTFGLPATLRGLPVIMLVGLLFLILGFLIGYFVR
jgi:hypothetical protein